MRHFLSFAVCVVSFCYCVSSAGAELCPPTRDGAGDEKSTLTDLYVMAFIKGKGTRNVKYVGDGNNKSWSLPKSPTTHYEAVCDYNGEILEVDLDPKYSSCSFKREASAVHTGCK